MTRQLLQPVVCDVWQFVRKRLQDVTDYQKGSKPSGIAPPLHKLPARRESKKSAGTWHLGRIKCSADRRSDPMLSLAAAASGYVLNAPAPMAARARAVSMDAAKMECAAAAASNSLPASHSCAEPALSAAP